MKRLEKIIRQMLKAEKEKARDRACPDEEHLASYVDNLLNAKDRKAVEEHLAGCDLCLEQVILCSEVKKEQESIDFKARTVDVVLSFLKSTVEVIKRAADIKVLPLPAPVSVRGRKVMTPNAVKFTREFRDLTVEVEVERLEEEVGEIIVRVSKDNHYLDNVRVSLFSHGKELMSYLTEEGHVFFEDVRFGKYTIKFSKNSDHIGEISLKVKEG